MQREKLFTKCSPSGHSFLPRPFQGWFIYDVTPASWLMSSSPLYYLIGSPWCGLTAVAFAEPHHLPAQEVPMAAARFLSLKEEITTDHNVDRRQLGKHFAYNSNKVCSPWMRLHANNVHQSIMMQPLKTLAPYRWPCVGRSSGQSTIIALVLHFGGCWWRMWRGWGQLW